MPHRRVRLTFRHRQHHRLQGLLGLTKRELKSEPLTYYSLQKKIQPHFVKETTA